MIPNLTKEEFYSFYSDMVREAQPVPSEQPHGEYHLRGILMNHDAVTAELRGPVSGVSRLFLNLSLPPLHAPFAVISFKPASSFGASAPEPDEQQIILRISEIGFQHDDSADKARIKLDAIRFVTDCLATWTHVHSEVPA